MLVDIANGFSGHIKIHHEFFEEGRIKLNLDSRNLAIFLAAYCEFCMMVVPTS
jgi:adenine-specific DNA methylase